MFENLKSTTLSNGTRIVTSAMPGVNSVSLCFSVGMGSRFEKKTESGWSHFVEHMLFKGSARRPTRTKIVRTLERIGGSYNAFTSRERTCVYARVPAESAPLAVDILGDMVTAPIFPEVEIENERKVILEEIKGSRDSPVSHCVRSAIEALWPRHPLGRPLSGTERSLAGIDRESLLAFHRARYTAAGMLVVAAGKVEHDRFLDLVKPFLDRLPTKPSPKSIPISRAAAALPIVCARRDTKQARMALACRTFPDTDSRFSALTVMNEILGGGMDSRLFLIMREKRGLAYSVSSCDLGFSDTGFEMIDAGIDASRLEGAVSLCGRVVRSMSEKPVGRRELEDVKASISGRLLLAGESSFECMFYIQDMLSRIGRVETPVEAAARIRAVTRDEVQTVAADVFRPENTTLSLVLPHDCKADPERLREVLCNG